MFMAAAHREMMVGEAETAKGYGFTVPPSAGQVDWEALKARRDQYVKKLNTNYTAGWKKEGVEVIEGGEIYTYHFQYMCLTFFFLF